MRMGQKFGYGHAHKHSLVRYAVLMGLAVLPVCGQSALQVSATVNGTVTTVSPGGSITLTAPGVGQAALSSVTVTTTGNTTATITGIGITGGSITVVSAPALPVVLTPNSSTSFSIQYAPTTGSRVTSLLSISFTEGTQPSVFSFNVTGTTPDLAFTYFFAPDGALTGLNPNDHITFAATSVGSSSTAVVSILNRGSAAGSLQSVGVSGADFSVTGSPAPATVQAGEQVSFNVVFAPHATGTSSGLLTVGVGNTSPVFLLSGLGARQAQYSYAWSNGSGSTPFSPGGTVAIPDTTVGQTTSVVITVTNSGTGDGQIPNISVTGSGLSVSNVPALPITLHPGGSQQFTLNFAPSQPGAVASAQLTIGSDTFTISATGVGSRLIYTYTSGTAAVTVTDGGMVIFPPLAVGNSESLTFTVQNTGTSAANITSINLTAASTVFPLTQVPALPLNLDPGASTTFTVGFAPNNVGNLTATLRVNSSSFTLSGTGTEPPALPAYQFQGPSGNQQPAQQPAVGLTLSTPYPSALQGTLTLTFVSSAFTDDTSIQFATGGRTVSFTIPANTTQALFPGNATSIPLQTGTTAGEIVIKPSFTMQGGFDLTPSSPQTLTLTIPKLAPQLINASVSSVTLSSFTVTLSGYSTTRAMRQFDIQITPKSGQRFSTTHLAIDVNSAATSWFQSTASQGFGGSFLVAIPFALSNGSTTTDLVHLIQSLSITATNDVAASNAVSVGIP